MVITVIIGGMISALQLHATLPRLPSGLCYPTEPLVELPDPLRSHAACTGCGDQQDMLQLHDRDFVGHRLNIDFHAPRWTGELLTFETGYQEVWRPELSFRLHAGGPQGQADYVQFIGRSRLVVFKQESAEDGTISLQCVSHPDHRLYRRGDRIVVEQLGRCRWYFASPDFGGTWRLERMEEPAYPGMGVDLVYDGDLLVALVYPDRKRARFEYKAQALSAIHFPNHYAVTISRDANGYPASITMLAPSDRQAERQVAGFDIWSDGGEVKQRLLYRDKTPPKPQVIGTYAYEHDNRGRIRHYVSACGREFKVDYASDDTGPHPVHVAIVTDLSTGNYRFMRHQAMGRNLSLEYGEGLKDQPLDKATVTERRVKQKDGFRMMTSEVQFGNASPVKIDIAGLKQSSRAAASPPPDLGATEAAVEKPKPTARFHYEFDDRGLPRVAIQGDRRWELHFDELGRVDYCLEPNGNCWRWKYTPTGQLAARIVQYGASPHAPEQITRYTYWPDRRLRRVTSPDDTHRDYTWSCGQLSTFTDRQGQVTRYRYNALLQLRGRQTAEEEERFDYDSLGRLHVRRRRHQGRIYRLVYRYGGGATPVAITGDDPSLPADDRRVARRARHYEADGSYVDEAFNARGLLLSRIGSNRQDRQYFYTPDGEPRVADGTSASHRATATASATTTTPAQETTR